MVIPPTKSVSSDSPSTRRRDMSPRPRPPLRLEPLKRPALPISILPEALVAAMNAVPDGVSLDLATLAPIVLQKLPLANATLSLWSYLLQPSALDEIFTKHRGRSFEDVLRFSTFVELIRDAMVLHHGSGRASFQKAREQGVLQTSNEAVYGKLGRTPISLSLGFFEDATARMREILPIGIRATPLPASLGEMTVVVLDGKQIKKVSKRLKPLRNKPGKVVGGKILVAYLPAEGMAVAAAADRDGEANDIRLMPQVVPRARAQISGIRLWVADRQFCDLNQPALLTEDGDHFLIRRSLKTHFHPDPNQPAQTTADARGRTVVEEWGWLGSEKQARRRYVRQIRLIRPDEDQVILVTDLLDGLRYPASDLLEVYLTRWQIERVFQQITEVFELRRLIGCTPEATIFQASFCLVLYNLLQVIRAYVAAGQAALPVDAVSMELIFRDTQKQLTALTELYPTQMIESWFAEELTREQIIARLQVLLAAVWKPGYRKAANAKPRPKVKKAKGSGAHTSVHKVLEADRKKRLKTGRVT
jgi:Transposase DDE domain